MGKFLDFFAKVSFTGYFLRERKVTKDIANNQYNIVAEEKENIAKQLKQLPAVVDEVSSQIDGDKIALAQRPIVKSRESFFDDTGLSQAQMRAKQLEVLKTVNTYNNLIDKESDSINKLNNIRLNWESKLATKIEFKKKKISMATAEQIATGLNDIDKNDLYSSIRSGWILQKQMSYNEAQIVVAKCADFGVKARLVELNAEASVKEQTQWRNSEDNLRRVARNQRLFVSGLILLLVALTLFFLAITPYASKYEFIIVSVSGSVFAALVFFVLWLLLKPILILTTKIMNKSFKNNARILTDRVGYLRGVILSEEYESGLDILYTGLIKSIEAYNDNNTTLRNYALVFLPQRVLDGLLPYVIEQMSIGATFNDALFKVDAMVDRAIAQQKAEERAERLEKENLRHNAEMEAQAKRRAEYERQRARAAQAAAAEARRANDELRANTRAVDEHTEEVKKLRKKLDE